LTGRRARLLEVLRASPHRITPRCRHFGIDAVPGIGPCGGCTWQHIAYSEQLRLKSELVDRLVRAVVPRAPAAKRTLAATPLDEPWGYRNKVHFVFGNHTSSLVMGHYVRGTRRVIPVVECPVHDARGNAFAFAARDTFAAAGLQFADTLRSLAIRVGCRTRELMAALIVSSDRDRRVLDEVERVPSQREGPKRILDLYAGSGLFAIPLALAGNDVVAVEENRLAVADGEAALKLNARARERCRFVARRVETALTT